VRSKTFVGVAAIRIFDAMPQFGEIRNTCMHTIMHRPQRRVVMSQHHTKQVALYFLTGYRSIVTWLGMEKRKEASGIYGIERNL
jgi:hypothetical protein